jgi:hypothetical protein
VYRLPIRGHHRFRPPSTIWLVPVILHMALLRHHPPLGKPSPRRRLHLPTSTQRNLLHPSDGTLWRTPGAKANQSRLRNSLQSLCPPLRLAMVNPGWLLRLARFTGTKRGTAVQPLAANPGEPTVVSDAQLIDRLSLHLNLYFQNLSRTRMNLFPTI